MTHIEIGLRKFSSEKCEQSHERKNHKLGRDSWINFSFSHFILSSKSAGVRRIDRKQTVNDSCPNGKFQEERIFRPGE
jgi:hypothetical protein